MARPLLLLSLLIAIVAYGNAFTVVAPVSSRQGTSQMLPYSNLAVPEQLARAVPKGVVGQMPQLSHVSLLSLKIQRAARSILRFQSRSKLR
jgi:hypothetical protein